MPMGACGVYPTPRLKQNTWCSERTNHPSALYWPRGHGIWATNLSKNAWTLFTLALYLTHVWIPPYGIKTCIKGKGIFFSLSQVGLRPGAFIPLISANVWSKVALLAMTYGCELWQLNATNLEQLVIARKFVAKTILVFRIRTHDEIARGLIGWYTMGATINLKKLVYLERLLHNSLGYLCNIRVEPTTNCNSNETYVILFQIYSCITN